MRELRILIADDHELIRRGVRDLLSARAGWHVVGEACDGEEAVTQAERLRPDVAILDFSMPRCSGPDAAVRIGKILPEASIIILTMHDSEHVVRQVLEAGARGLIFKTDAVHHLLKAVEAVSEGKIFFLAGGPDSSIPRELKGDSRLPLERKSKAEQLTLREREIMRLLAQGMTSKSAAAHLSISMRTVETHRVNISRKLGFHSIADLVRYAIVNGILIPTSSESSRGDRPRRATGFIPLSLLLCISLSSGFGRPEVILAQPSAKRDGFRVEEASIAETLQAIRTHRVTCRQLVERYFTRIQAYDQRLQAVAGLPGQRVRLNSIILINPEALADADRLDAEFARTGKLRPLHGIPVIVKDNYDTAGLQTTGGSLAMKGNIPETDAFMVKRLREAGAIVLAKSNMAEWAFSPYLTESSIAGITRNPFALDRVPAGSSGGTGAAVSASLGMVGLGTDTGNSIRGPSSHNDLVGIRPTIGLTSRDGIIPLNFNNDVGGPMARSVSDAAAVLSAVAGFDPADPITKMSEGYIEKDYTKFLDKNGLKGARIGVFRRYVEKEGTDPQIKALTDAAVADLRARGAIMIDPFDLPDYDTLTRGLGCGDFQADLNTYLAKHGMNAPYTTLGDIVASGLYLPYIENQMKGAVAPKDTKPEEDRNGKPNPNARPQRRGACADVYHDPPKILFRDALLNAMEKDHLDAIVYPTWSNAPRKVGEMKSPAGDNSQVLSPQTGFPAITVPMGFTSQESDTMLPAGLTFLGRTFSEPTLIKLAYAYEQATHHRRPPPLFGPLP